MTDPGMTKNPAGGRSPSRSAVGSAVPTAPAASATCDRKLTPIAKIRAAAKAAAGPAVRPRARDAPPRRSHRRRGWPAPPAMGPLVPALDQRTPVLALARQLPSDVDDDRPLHVVADEDAGVLVVEADQPHGARRGPSG